MRLRHASFLGLFLICLLFTVFLVSYAIRVNAPPPSGLLPMETPLAPTPELRGFVSEFFFSATIIWMVGLAALMVWLWAMVRLLLARGMDGTERIVWTLVLIFLNFVGAILFILIRPDRISNQQPATG